MERLRIVGGRPLEGTVRISGAKNASLPDLCAALLTDQAVRLSNVPEVRDIRTMGRVLRDLGAQVEFEVGGRVDICARQLTSVEATYDLVKTMRASVLVLGPLLAREGRARVSLPGGCAIGAWLINLHIEGLQKLGATVRTEHGYVEAEAGRLSGAEILFDKISVTGTENLMMAATLAHGKTVLQNAACEPEIADLASMLIAMGAHIKGAGTPTITIEGVNELKGTKHHIIPDRIEAGMFLIAGAMTNGNLEIMHINPTHLGSIIQKLRDTGVRIETGSASMTVQGNGQLQAADVATKEY